MNRFTQYLMDNAQAQPAETPRMNLGDKLRQDLMAQREAESRRAAAIVAGQPAPNMGDLKLTQDASTELGMTLPAPQTPEARSIIQQQLAASRLISAFENAPATARWSATLENAQIVRNDAASLALAERIYAAPWSVGRQTLETLKGTARTVLPTLSTGATGGALIAETTERRGLTIAGSILADAPERIAAMEEGGLDPQQMRQTLAGQLRQQATLQLQGDERAQLIDLAARFEQGEDPVALMRELGEIEVTPATDRPLYEFGEAVAGLFAQQLAPRVGYEETIATQYGEAIGSFGAFMATSFLTGPLGSFYLATAAGVDDQYNRAIGAGLEHDAAMKYAIKGAPAGFIQAISVEFAMRRLPIPAKRRLGAVIKDLVVTGAAEAAVETTGAIMQNLIQQQYDETQGAFDDTLVPGIISGSAAATLRGLALTLSRGARRGVFRDIERAEASKDLEQTMTALRDGLEGNELREAVPDRFRDWAESVVEGNPARDTVYVSAEGLQALAQSAPDPAMLQRIIDVLPGVTQAEFDAAVENGTDFAIPMATYMTDILGTDLDLLLTQHTRFDPNNMTTFERVTQASAMAKEMADLAKRVKTLEADNMQADVTPLERARLDLYNEARGRIAQAGYDARSAASYAAQYAAFMSRTAARSTLPLDEFLKRYPAADINIDGQVIDMRRPGDPATLEDVMAELRDADENSDLSEEARAAQTELATLGIDPAAMTDEQIRERLRVAVGSQPQQQAAGAAAEAGAGRGPLGAPQGQQGTLSRLLSSTSSIVNQEPRVGPNGEGPWFHARPTTTPATGVDTRRLPDLERASPGPVAGVREVATRYMQRAGLPVRHQASYVKVDVARATEVAALYDAMAHDPFDPEVRAAYEALAAETIAQYEAVLELGYTFEFIDGADPYATPADAIRDMQDNKHLWVFSTEDGYGQSGITEQDRAENPMLAPTEYKISGRKALINDLFRAVHDVFGHGSEGASFGPRGEENAWQAHVRMFTPLAARAMTTETRGQNSWVNYGPMGEQNRRDPKNTVFADQKIGLLPEWVSTVGQAADIDNTQEFNQPGTPAFDAWFGDSKVVDADGKPLVVYHGTGADFDVFDAGFADAGALGFHFGTALQADTMAGIKEGPVMPVYLRAENPLRLRDEGAWDAAAVGHQLIDAGVVTSEGMMTIEMMDDPVAQEEALRAAVQAAGYDSIVYLNREEGISREDKEAARKRYGDDQFHIKIQAPDVEFQAQFPSARDSWVVFEPTQIKSVFNRGTFDPSDPRILFQPAADGSGMMNAPVFAPNRPQLPVRDDGMVELHHWSARQRDVIDPQFAGTGPYNSRERRAGTKLSFYGIAPRLNRREAGTGYVKEPALGGVHHIVAVDPQKMYPYFEDPDAIMAKVDAWVEEEQRPRAGGRSMVSGSQRVAKYEQMIHEAGYLGYYVTEDGSGRAPLGNVAVVFEALRPETAYSEDSGQVFYQSETGNNWYYSALTNAVENAKQAQATAKDWAAILPKMEGVKKAEIDWSGVLDWLEGRKGQITREEVARYLRSQEIDIVTITGTEDGGTGELSLSDVDTETQDPDESWIEEVARDSYYDDILQDMVDDAAGTGSGTFSAWDIGDDAKNAYLNDVDADDQEAIDAADDFEWESAASAALQDKAGDKALDTSDPLFAAVAAEVENRWERFEAEAERRAESRARESYYEYPTYDLAVTVGNTTYTATQDSSGEVYDQDGNTHSGIQDWLDSLSNGDSDDPGVKFQQYTESGGREYREILLTIPNLDEIGPNETRRVSEFVEDAHFKQPNIVVHARVKNRAPAGSTKASVLFVEEIQSDLGTDWREAGGQPAGFSTEAVTRAEAAREELRGPLGAAQAEYREARRGLIERAREHLQRQMDTELPEGTIRSDVMALIYDGPDMAAHFAIAERVWFDGRQTTTTSISRLAVVSGITDMFSELAEAGDPAFNDFRELTSRLNVMEGQARDLDDAVRDARRDTPSIPFTPFDGQIAYEVMLKRLLNLAAEEGSTALAWTPGYMQAERWSGAVQNVVRRIDWQTDARPAKTPAQTLRVVTLDGANGADVFLIDDQGVIKEKTKGRIPADQVVGKNLSELIGGPMTRAILESESGSQGGQNIVIGGDGYKIAYDQQMKKFVEKWAKKFGGKVRTEMLPDFLSEGRVKENISRMTLEQLETLYDVIYPTPEERAKAVDYIRGLAVSRIQRARSEQERAAGMFEQLLQDYDTFGVAARERRVSDALVHARRLQAHMTSRAFATLVSNTGELANDPRPIALEAVTDQIAALRENAQGRYDTAIDDLAKMQDPNNPDDVARAMRDEYARMVPVENSPRGFSVMQRKDALPPELAELVFKDTGRPVWYIDITDEMRAAALQPQPLFQSNRGKIVLPPRYQRPTITLFEGADLSTLLHEMGHQYLYILQNLARDDAMGEDQRKDWETVQNWWRSNAAAVAKDAGNGVTEADVIRYLDQRSTGNHDLDNAINVGLQEQWARGFERYLLEGQSPSMALADAFRSFKAWLVSIYRRAESLNVSISPEMRDVFDRMFATEEEIAFARETEKVDRLVADSAKALGVTEEEYQRLVALHDEAREEAEQGLLARIMEPIRRQRQAEYQREREEVRAAAYSRIVKEPVHRVREWVGNRRWLEGDAPAGLPTEMRFDRDQLIARYGEQTLRLLPRGRYPLYSKQGAAGMDIDEVAGWFGFSSGDDMITQLQRAPGIDAAVKAETDAEMLKRYPDPAKDASIEDAAVEALHGDKAGQLLVAELRALSRLPNVKGKPTPRQQAREVARRTIDGMVARKAIRSSTWRAAERKAAGDAQEALALGDNQRAFDAKRRQLMNHMLYSESRKAEELVVKLENRVGRLKKKSTRENLAGEYLEAIDAILEQYEFRKVSGRKLDRRNALIAYVEMMAAAGRESELAIPAEVLANARQVNYMELTVQHMQGVLDALVNIEHTARWKQKLRDKKAERDLNEVVDGVVDAMAENVAGQPRGRIPSPADRRRAALRNYLNLILNASTLLRKIDGFRDMGAAYMAIKDRIDAGTRDLTNRRIELADKLDTLYGVYTRNEQNQMSVKRHNDAAGASMSKWDVISVALNMGNVDNLDRLTDPKSRGFTRDQVDRIVAELNDRDWSFVQSMWDLIDTYWGEIAAREKRLTGVTPKKVQAVPFETPSGRTLRGGYYPIMYDGDLSVQVNAEQTAELFKNMQAGSFGKAQTANGHLKERKEGSGGRPLMLGIEVAHRHLGRVVHDLALSEAVNSTWRVLQHPKLRAAFIEKGLLQDLETLELWVQDVATGQLAAADLPSRVFRRLKSNFTLAKLGFNMSTVMVQLTGATQSMVVVGHKNFAVATAKYMANVPRHVAAVEELSEFMRNRQTTFNKDINDILGDVTLGPLEATWDRALRKYMGPAAFWLMQKVQYYSIDIPTWMAAYDAGLKQGLTQDEAVRNADATLVRAQAGGEFSDRSAFERGTTSRTARQSDLTRLFTTLGSYMFAKFNVAYERTGRAQRVFRDEGFNAASVQEAVRYAYDMAFLFILEAVAYAALMGRLPGGDDEEEPEALDWAAFIARETALGAAATLPYVRDLTGPMQGFAAGGAYGGIGKEASEVIALPFLIGGDDEGVGLTDVKALVRGVGLATGIPSTALNRVIDGVWRESEGEDVAPIEYLVGRR